MDVIDLNPEDQLTKKEKAWLRQIRKTNAVRVKMFLLVSGKGSDIRLAKTVSSQQFWTPNQLVVVNILKLIFLVAGITAILLKGFGIW